MNSKPEKIEAFSAYIGGGLGPCYYVDLLEQNKIGYSTEFHLKDMEIIEVSDSTWDSFKNQLTQIGANKWKSENYPDELILDGTSWNFKFKTGVIDIDSKGSNSFPNRFDEYIEIMLVLLQGRKFH
jgi:hypothetical protein|tara:strand:- start:1395 stop:1772 length:378 start_codon:yes stop_codon:yes gene_type:complete